jgi:hypothetical protein
VAKLSLSGAWDETRAVLARDGKLVGAVALALLVLPQTVLGLFTPVDPAEMSGRFDLLLIVVLLAAIAGQVAINRLALPPSATVAAGLSRGLTRMPAVLVSLFIVFLIVFLLFIAVALVLMATGLVGAPVTGGQPPMELVAVLLVLFVAAYAAFQLVVPAAAAEQGGPLRLVRRSWGLSKHHYWRLVAFLLIVIAGMLMIWLTAQLVIGLAFTALLGPPERGSLGLLLISLGVALAQAGWTVVTSVMVARIYAQLGGQAHADVSVPTSGS